MADKISVIIPVFRTEKYLDKCLSSVISQTYTELEIILVDDGSDDSSPQICEKYAERDSRIKVIHKKNGGLSSARNKGLDEATGDFVAFVDSDDYIENDMYSYLMGERGDCDIVCCSYFSVRGGENKKAASYDEKKVLTPKAALHELIKDEKLKNYVWNKVFARSLFDGLRFPEGMNFEDIPVTCQLFTRADSVCVLPEAKYNYLIRSDGISKTESVKNLYDRYKAHMMRFRSLVGAYPEEEGEMLRHMTYAAKLLAMGLLKEKNGGVSDGELSECFAFFRENADRLVSLDVFNSFEKKQIKLLAGATKKDFIRLKGIDYIRKADKLIRR